MSTLRLLLSSSLIQIITCTVKIKINLKIRAFSDNCQFMWFALNELSPHLLVYNVKFYIVFLIMSIHVVLLFTWYHFSGLNYWLIDCFLKWSLYMYSWLTNYCLLTDKMADWLLTVRLITWLVVDWWTDFLADLSLLTEWLTISLPEWITRWLGDWLTYWLNWLICWLTDSVTG